jgi:tetratricopeptide (TPR) repeat protein
MCKTTVRRRFPVLVLLAALSLAVALSAAARPSRERRGEGAARRQGRAAAKMSPQQIAAAEKEINDANTVILEAKVAVSMKNWPKVGEALDELLKALRDPVLVQYVRSRSDVDVRSVIYIDDALDACDKIAAANPGDVNSYVIKGAVMIMISRMIGRTDAQGRTVALPGTIETLRKGLQMAPNGQYASSFTAGLASIGSEAPLGQQVQRTQTSQKAAASLSQEPGTLTPQQAAAIKRQIDALIDQAGNAAGAKNLPGVVAPLQQAAALYLQLKDNKNAAATYVHVGTAQALSGNSQGAMDAFNKAIACDPTDADAYYFKGDLMIITGKVGQPLAPGPAEVVRESFRKYLELAPNGEHADDAKHWLEKVGPATGQSAAMAQSAPDGPAPQLTPEQAAAKRQVDGLVGLANRAIAARDWAGALGLVSQLLTGKNGEDKNLQNYLSAGTNAQGVLQVYDKVIAADPTNAEAYFLKGATLITLKGASDAHGNIIAAPPEAMQALRKYLELAPNGNVAGTVKQWLASIAAAGPSGLPPSISKAVLGAKAIQPGETFSEPVTEFVSDTPKIYCAWEGQGLKGGTPVRGVWMVTDVGSAAPANSKIDEATWMTPRTGNFAGIFTLSKPNNGFPAGKYRLEIYLGSELAMTVPFSVVARQ